MTKVSLLIPALIGLSLVLGSAGCGSKGPQPVSEDEHANKKVEAIKRLADALAKDPKGGEAYGALEDFRNTPIDPQKHAKQIEEIVQVYRQRIQGKYRGFVAEELQTEMGQFLVRSRKGG